MKVEWIGFACYDVEGAWSIAGLDPGCSWRNNVSCHGVGGLGLCHK